MQEREIRKVIQYDDRQYIQKYAHEIRKKDILLWDGGKNDLEVTASVKDIFCNAMRVFLSIECIYSLSVHVAAQGFLALVDVKSVDFERHSILIEKWCDKREKLYILLKQTSKE